MTIRKTNTPAGKIYITSDKHCNVEFRDFRGIVLWMQACLEFYEGEGR